MDNDERRELAGLMTSVKERLARERGLRGRLRSLSTPVRLTLVVGLLGIVVAAVARFSLRPDAGDHPLLRLLVVGSILSAGVLVLARSLFRPLSKPVAPPISVLALAGLALLLPTVLALLPTPYEHPPGVCVAARFGTTGFWTQAGTCLLSGAAIGSPFLLLLWILDRMDGPDASRTLLIAGASGLAGVLALLLHCPLVSTRHLLAGHAPVPIALFCTAFLLSRLFRRM